MSDDLDALMNAAQGGDADAFAAIIVATQSLLRATMLRDTADPELADELAQEAFVTAWEKRDQYRAGTSPRAWLLSIARSRLIDRNRRQDRDRRHMGELVRMELLRHRPAGNPVQDRLMEALRACLAEAGDEHRRLIELIYHRGLSCEDAAVELGIRADACRQRVSRLHRRLRDCAERRLGSMP